MGFGNPAENKNAISHRFFPTHEKKGFKMPATFEFEHSDNMKIPTDPNDIKAIRELLTTIRTQVCGMADYLSEPSRDVRHSEAPISPRIFRSNVPHSRFLDGHQRKQGCQDSASVRLCECSGI
jgi:hypothetical protein